MIKVLRNFFIELVRDSFLKLVNLIIFVQKNECRKEINKTETN
jgi:hypothetical protein